MKNEVATLAGGCFWCTEAIYQRLKGVVTATPGYAGGTAPNPTYTQVHDGDSGYAECIQIVFDPEIIPYEKILDIFWHTHNPTTPNQQGYDTGPEYRSIIFYHSDKQKQIAEKSLAEFAKEKVYPDKIVTQIVPYTTFYIAEDYHQNYYERHKSNLYCNFIISPKIHQLMKEYRKDIKEEFLK